MSQDKKVNPEKENNPKSSAAASTAATDVYGDRRASRPSSGSRGPKRGFRRDDKPRDEFEQKILDIARVTRVMAGGKRMNFRACVAIGDKKGNVAVALGKGADVSIAVNKAVNKAKKQMIKVPIVNETIPHVIFHKLGAARIMLKPASKGKGIISGGVVRFILELAGIKNITSKTIGTNNKINNARCTIEALDSLKKVGPDNKPGAKNLKVEGKKEETTVEKTEKTTKKD